MEKAGWIVDVDHVNNENYQKMCGNNTFWGYGYLRDGSISTVFEGSGKGTLIFGNCNTRGAVYVYLNRKQVGYAPPNSTDIISHFDYKSGDKLMLQDKKAAIISIQSLRLSSCYGTVSTSENEILGKSSVAFV